MRDYREWIEELAAEYDIDPLLLAGVLFAENRNDYNWLQGADWTSIFSFGVMGGPEVKNVFAVLKQNPSLGITEVSLAVAAMMDDPNLVPADYGSMSREDRDAWHSQVARNLSSEERKRIIANLGDPKLALEYAAKYLHFLGQYRDYDGNLALQLSDYNRGLSTWNTTTEYGERINLYRKNIEHALTVQLDVVPPCLGGTGCARYYDRVIYGDLP